MISNDEHREVAARLREQKPWSVFTDFQDCIGDLCDAVFEDEGDLNDMFRLQKALADLIEPEPERTCKNVYDEMKMDACDNGFECSECGEKVEDCEGYHVKGTWNYCPGCRAKVVD